MRFRKLDIRNIDYDFIKVTLFNLGAALLTEIPEINEVIKFIGGTLAIIYTLIKIYEWIILMRKRVNIKAELKIEQELKEEAERRKKKEDADEDTTK